MTKTIETIDTPAFVVNEAVALKNITNFQTYCNHAGLALRPHIKTHKSIHFAQAQLAAGAIGITCQKISEAEAMVADGIKDIFITYNILGPTKLARLRALSDRLRALSVVADNMTVVRGLVQTYEYAAHPLTVLVECDTGAGRCGVQTPQAAVKLAKEIYNAPGLIFGGLMTYPAIAGSKDVVQFMKKAKRLLDENNLACPVISSGGSPDMWKAATDNIITEYRIGTYIYNDRSLVEYGTCKWEDCAGHVVATVVSTPTAERAVIDAGSKVLTSDLLGLQNYGYVLSHPEVIIDGLSEEHSTLKVNPKNPLAIGEKIQIIPNHVCVVSNMFDKIWILSMNGKMSQLKINARGKVV